MMLAWALTVLVAGCSREDGAAEGYATGNADTSRSEDAPPTDLGSRLKSGDTTICTDPQVQQTALKTLVDPTVLQEFEQHGGRLVFDTVSAAGVNKDIDEITCSANLNYNGGRSPLQYQVRPALDHPGGIVVETLFANRDNLNLYIQIVEQGRARQQATAATEVRPNEVDATSTPSEKQEQELSYAKDIKSLERHWLALENECRGGPHTPDDAVCTERDRVADELESRGVCWAYSDWRVYPPDYNWHPCSQARPKGWHPSKGFENSNP